MIKIRPRTAKPPSKHLSEQRKRSSREQRLMKLRNKEHRNEQS